jgi:predicted nucleic acid-binding protein
MSTSRLFKTHPIESLDYVQAARLDNRCRAAGAQCGEVDMLLCAVADRNDWTILTNDAGLIRCIEIIEQNAERKRRGHRLLEVV